MKEAPGGLRDYQAALWLRQIIGDSPDLRGLSAADEEMAAQRCRISKRHSLFACTTATRATTTRSRTSCRKNGSEAFACGVRDGIERKPRRWMRLYFRHARTLNRQLLRYIEQKMAQPVSLRERLFSAARSVRARRWHREERILRSATDN